MNATASGASNHARPASACEKVLGRPETLYQILLHTDGSDHEALQKVAKLWRAELSTPYMWQKQFALSKVHAPSRSLYVLHEPFENGSLLRSGTERKQFSRTLGVFAGEKWKLRTGFAPSLPASLRALELLDSVARLRTIGLEAIPVERAERAEFDKWRRTESLEFLLDRAYRLEHGIHVPVFREDSRAAIAALACMGVCSLVCVGCAQVAASESSWIVKSAAFVGLGACMVATCGGAFVMAIMAHVCSPAMVRNVAWGYPDFVRLNRLAREFAAEHRQLPSVEAFDVPNNNENA